ncbi:MAG: glycine/sarcosine/betaine reductase complex component C subunit beta [Limnochordia bacterium]|nr:glycine/sarcosine/betaine reductase complex component C subunit beta [Bacillota bacterium]HBG09330.1 glycine reductase [Bacillota bacterium]
MTNPVIKAASYCLFHAPDMVLTHGTTLMIERDRNPDSPLLTAAKEALRPFEEVVAYPPNQVYIGNLTPEELAELPQPWYENPVEAQRAGRLGEIFPLDELIAMMKISDSFNLVLLAEEFAQGMVEKLADHPLFTEQDLAALQKAQPLAEIQELLEKQTAVPLEFQGQVVGCVKQAHEWDVNLKADVMFENLAAKASGAWALRHLFWKNELDPSMVEYIIETSEEACGDMNQRGGGNFAKSIGEVCGCINATGSDTRSFCAGPAHGLVEAAALVKSGIYKNVVVLGGGAVAKLGMNSRDHIKKEVPVLEDVLGSFAVLISADDGVNPIIRTDSIGRHRIGTGSSPQAVTTALVTDPLSAVGLSITDVDKFSVEMQNPEITTPAGAGDVPLANYKMIAALGVRQGALERSELDSFVAKHGLKGWAPTQGHIPSGVPYLGFAREAILSGKIKRAMIVGKGSLFLGRLTNLFDGVSFIVEANPGKETAAPAEPEELITVGVTLLGSEHGLEEVLRGAELAQKRNRQIKVVAIGPKCTTSLTVVEANSEEEQHRTMEELLKTGKIHACVTMNYSFPLGVTTIGRVVAPASGREMLIASTTGMAASNRTKAMHKNAVLGIAVAKALGIEQPSVGILNVDGAVTTERSLRELEKEGYTINWAKSSRADGQAIMRGNDVLAGTPDVLVTDSLTGNIMVKMLSALNTGGSIESVGYGYGPGVGEGYQQIINIVSRASGAPVIAGALEFAAEMARAKLPAIVTEELTQAKLMEQDSAGTVEKPPVKPVDQEITGIDVLEIESAAEALWKENIYAEAGMGCTGPVIMVAPEDLEAAKQKLKELGFLSE